MIVICGSILLLIVANAIAENQFPIDILRCGHGDTECLSKSITQGIPSIDLEPLDPLKIDSIRNLETRGININTTNVKVTGLQQGVINDVNGPGIKPTDSNFEIHASFPLLTVSGDYDISGNIFGKINEQGQFQFSFYENKVTVKFICSSEVRNGEEYLIIQKVTCESTISRMTVHFNNSKLDAVAKALRSKLFPEIQKNASDSIADFLQSLVQRVFNTFPYEDFFIH